ncbi:MAG: tRNA (adenosine(37)-N6)-threonylcarbamoyltransferase complex ATPase subunit type 1 TsaE [Oscillospiraceae bacterium]
MAEYISDSQSETEEIGKKIAENLRSTTLIAIRGDLAAGKTCLVSGIAKGLGFFGETSSPTFAIVNEYLGGRMPLYHFDMYRIETWEDLYSIGFFEYLESDGVLAIEWSENIEGALQGEILEITIEKLSDTRRKIITGKRIKK